MAALVGRGALVQAVRLRAADRDSAGRLAAAVACSGRFAARGGASRCARLHGRVAATRLYSSDSKDDLRLRYLDGEDDGKFHLQVCGGETAVSIMLS